MTTATPQPWTIEKSATLYCLDDWAQGYFTIGETGDLHVCAPTGDGQHATVSLMDICDSLRQRGLDPPLLLRLENLVDDRLKTLNESFRNAISELGYRGSYKGVYPIKVNQQAHVVGEITKYGKRFGHGLEVGSKAELLIAMSIMNDTQGMIICNGYKDEEFISLGLHATLLGHRCFFVIENPMELDLVIRQSQRQNIAPHIGVRLKLGTNVEGHWGPRSGDQSLFGLSTTQLLEAVDKLRQANMLDTFELLHFHLGSQVPNIRNIRNGVIEACRYYTNLVKEGVPLGYLDIGGGLAVDYDGSQSTDGHSRNYTIKEYCLDIVEALQESLDQEHIAHPVIISESGRATVASTAILLFNILNATTKEPLPLPEPMPESLPEPIANTLHVVNNITVKRLQECYNDLMHYRAQMRDLFDAGEIDLRMRGLAENLYLRGLQAILDRLPEMRRIPAELETLPDQMADVYYANFSVFQSLPDAWAIDQIFPVMPIHKLDTEPNRRAIIADITCDCDGKLDKFFTDAGPTSTLPLHPISDDDDYMIGVFLVGAYQETLGDLHNLFGDTNVASVRINADKSFDIIHEFEGDTIEDVLSYVEYDSKELQKNIRIKAENAVKQNRITVRQRQKILTLFSESLRGYTYFEQE